MLKIWGYTPPGYAYVTTYVVTQNNRIILNISFRPQDG